MTLQNYREKVTPNQMAKYLIQHKLEQLVDYLREQDDMEDATENECEEVQRHLIKHGKAIVKKFNLEYFPMVINPYK